MWIKTISEFSKTCNFAGPADSSGIENCEKELGFKLHDSLRNLLLETNGVYEKESETPIIWDVEEIAKQNKFHRTYSDYRNIYMPFENLIFFAGNGSGDLFAFTITGTNHIRDDIFLWDHEDDSRTWVAPNLKTYLNWWLSGQIRT